MLPVEQPGSVEQIRLKHLDRLHTVLHHKLQFPRLGSVRKGSYVGTHRHGHTVGQLAVKLLHVKVELLMLERCLLRGGCVRRKILRDGKGRHGVDLPFPHQAHGFVAELVGMVDGGYARLGSIESGRLAGAMHGNPALQAGRLGYGRGQLRFGVLDDGVKLAVFEEVAAGFINLDKVGAVLNLLADHGHQLIGSVGVGGIGEHVLLGVEVERVFVAAQDVDGVTAKAQPRPGNKPLVDCVADSGVSRARALGTHIPFGGIAGQKVGFGGERGHDYPLRHGFHHRLKIFGSGVEEEMDVGVDQPRHQRGIAKIDGLRSCRVGYGGAGGDNLLSFDQDFSGGKNAAGFDVEQARGMENDGVRRSRSLCQGKRRKQEAGKDYSANVVVSTLHGGDGLQDIRPARERITMIHTMRLRRTIREVTYEFEDLRDLLAKASPYRSGDALAGIAAESGEQRAAAQMTLADLPLRAFLDEALVPYESDEVTRLIIDSHDPVAFRPVASLNVGDFRDWLLSDAATGEALAAVTPGLTPEMVAAVSKLMRVQDLILVARKIRVITRFRTTVGLQGRLSTRLQPNHPLDDPAGIAASMIDGLLLGSGDAVIGINPVSDNVGSVKTLLELIDHVRQKYAIPVQSCVLAHVTTLMEALAQGAPVDLVFQSIAGTEDANRSFGVSLALLDEACAAARELKRGALFEPAHHGGKSTLGDNVMYFETGQGSALSADAHHGVDQQTCEARAYAVARRYRPMLVNTVVGFIGPEYLYDGKQIIRAGLEDHFCGKLLGLPMGCDVCYTNHAEADQDDMDVLLTLLGAAGVNYIMGVPGADDVMLHYQSTSFHDALYLRRALGLRPAPEFEAWLHSDARLRLSVPAFLA